MAHFRDHYAGNGRESWGNMENQVANIQNNAKHKCSCFFISWENFDFFSNIPQA